MQKVLITGSSGMLGRDVVKALASRKMYRLFGVDKFPYRSMADIIDQKQIDISDLTQLKVIINQINPDIIIHLAAIVNLKTCENHFNYARFLHVDATRLLARQNCKIVYISTDSVFNGERGIYSEQSVPDPLNNYAITKLLGEYAVSANNKNHLIIRTNIFGFNNPLKGSLAEWALSSLSKGEAISGYTNVIFNAIYTKHLAPIISKLVEINLQGIINIASTTAISKYKFLVELAKAAGFPKSRVKKAEMVKNNSTNIMRPLKTSLCVDYANTLIKLPTIELGIKDLVTDFKKEYNYE